MPVTPRRGAFRPGPAVPDVPFLHTRPPAVQPGHGPPKAVSIRRPGKP